MLLGKPTYIYLFKGGPFVRVVIRSFAGCGNLSCSKWRASSASLTAKKVWASGSTGRGSSGSRIQATHRSREKVEHHHPLQKGPFLRGIDILVTMEGIHCL